MTEEAGSHWYYFAYLLVNPAPVYHMSLDAYFGKQKSVCFYTVRDLLFSRYFQVSPALRCLGDLKVHRPSWSSTRGRKAVNTIHAESNIKAKEAVYLVESPPKASNTAASDLSISAWWWGTR